MLDLKKVTWRIAAEGEGEGEGSGLARVGSGRTYLNREGLGSLYE